MFLPGRVAGSRALGGSLGRVTTSPPTLVVLRNDAWAPLPWAVGPTQARSPHPRPVTLQGASGWGRRGGPVEVLTLRVQGRTGQRALAPLRERKQEGRLTGHSRRLPPWAFICFLWLPLGTPLLTAPHCPHPAHRSCPSLCPHPRPAREAGVGIAWPGTWQKSPRCFTRSQEAPANRSQSSINNLPGDR